jgi:uncharacterized protein (TIGR03437 family)
VRRRYKYLAAAVCFMWLPPAVVLAQPLNPRARRALDQGPVDSGMRLPHMTIALRRTPGQQEALDRLLSEQQDPASPNFQKWLTPEEFGARFGATAQTLDRIANWLRAQGFTVQSVARGRSFIVFSGTAGQVRNAFETEIHRYRAAGKPHFAASAPPVLPAEFQDLVTAIRGLDDFYLEPPKRLLPMANLTNGSHALAPGDVARIYQVGGSGPARTIAIAGISSIDLNDIRKFRSTFQLPASDPQTVLVGDDPGTDPNGGLLEADSDIEWAAAVAQNAPLIYVYAKDPMDTAQQIIDQNLAPILSFSFGACEPQVPATDAAAIRALAQQGNAQGITWVAASGDAGAAACDQGSYPASQGLSVSFPASLPEVTGIGGTEFNEGPNAWGFVLPDLSSVYGYLPEIAWNDTSATLQASGGGASIFYPQPAWQTGAGVPANGVRNVPDVALSASPHHDPYIVFSSGKTYGAGGTSLSTPVFASMLALSALTSGTSVDTTTGLGNVNPSLYRLASDPFYGPIVFHDITSGNNVVPCLPGTPDCTNGALGYNAGPGYDQVTGLGSPSSLPSYLQVATTTTVTLSSAQVNEGASVSVTATVQAYNGVIPVGSVGLFDNDGFNPIASAVLDATGAATMSHTFAPGSHSIIAKYSGQAPFGRSSSPPVILSVIPHPPQVPTLISPANKSTGASVSVSLNWNQTATAAATYDVYLGTASPPPFWGNVSALLCWPALAPNTTYYWKIVAKNASGSAESPVWAFATSGQTVYRISRIAGNGAYGFSGDGGPAEQSLLDSPVSVALDSASNLYVADSGNYRLRKITPDGTISTVAGTGASTYSGDGGPALSAGLGGFISGIAVDRQGNLYLAVESAHRIRMITPDGTISTIAGTGTAGYSGDGGPALAAMINQPLGVVVDSAGTVYVADNGNNCIRKIVAGMISTFAGQCGSPAGLQGNGGPATSALLDNPQAVAVDTAGDVYIVDWGGDLRKVSNGIITEITDFHRGNPQSLATDSAGSLYFADVGWVGKVTNHLMTPIAGNASLSSCCTPGNGMAGTSTILFGSGIAVDAGGKVYLAGGGGYNRNYVWSLTPTSGPPVAAITPGGVVNAAGFGPGPVAPGSIATVFGSFAVNLGDPATAPPLATIRSGLSIQFQTPGILSAPLFYVSAEQVNLQIPWELAGQTSVKASAVLNGNAGPSQTLALAPFAPGIFAVNANGQGAVVDSSYRLVDLTNPTTAGNAIQIFCTGLGAVTNPPPSGNPASGTTLSLTTSNPTVTIGGVDAPVLFSGLAPGAIGEYQVNVQVPPGITPGTAVPLTVSIGGVSSNTVTIAVH